MVIEPSTGEREGDTPFSPVEVAIFDNECTKSITLKKVKQKEGERELG